MALCQVFLSPEQRKENKSGNGEDPRNVALPLSSEPIEAFLAFYSVVVEYVELEESRSQCCYLWKTITTF